MTFRLRWLCLVLPLATMACVDLDVFVFEGKTVTDDSIDMMQNSIIPKAYRQEIYSPNAIVSDDGSYTVVDAYLLTHDTSTNDPTNTDATATARHGIAVLYCHGQGNDIMSSQPRYDYLWSLGYTVLAVDQRGFGKTIGKPTDVGVYSDTRGALKWLMAYNTPTYHVGVYGRSLGTAMCLRAAADLGAQALVLESPIASIQDIISDSLVVDVPSDDFVDSLMDNATEIPNFQGNLLIMHGTADTYVNPKYGIQLSGLAQGHAKTNTLWLVPGADHETVPCIDKTDPPTDNTCIGGLGGVSSDYDTYVTNLFDKTFDL